jgi:uncharacterized membrane protein YuzA (DUF378 family)
MQEAAPAKDHVRQILQCALSGLSRVRLDLVRWAQPSPAGGAAHEVQRVFVVHRRNAMSMLAKTLLVIAIIGALNWGLIGFFNFNLVAAIFGGGSAAQASGISRIIYAIVGLCAIAALVMLPSLHGRGDFEHHRPA